MRPATWKLLWLVIAGLLLGTSSDARELGAALTGSELLVELDRRVPGEKPSGIYSITSAGELECVITQGRSPVWSPDHTKFAFFYSGRVHLADLKQRKWYPIDHIGEWVASALPAGPDRFLCWTPEGTRVVAWSDRPRDMPPGPPGEAFWAGKPEGAGDNLATVLITSGRSLSRQTGPPWPTKRTTWLLASCAQTFRCIRSRTRLAQPMNYNLRVSGIAWCSIRYGHLRGTRSPSISSRRTRPCAELPLCLSTACTRRNWRHPGHGFGTRRASSGHRTEAGYY